MNIKIDTANVCMIAGILMLLVYHVQLYYQLRRHPERTSIGVANLLRVHWAQSILETNNGILAVQTMRNLTMAATFLASTAIVVSLGSLNLALTLDRTSTVSVVLGLGDVNNWLLWVSRLLILCADLLFSSFNFMLAVRYFNHVAFMLGQPAAGHTQPALHKPGLLIHLPALEGSTTAVKSAADTLNRGAAYYTLGMRGYYLVVPILLGLIGDVWFLAGTLLLIYFLRHIDRAA